ncbi:MAG: transcriptional regulator [bacterium]|nr:transcriptional regulator [bacterium]
MTDRDRRRAAVPTRTLVLSAIDVNGKLDAGPLFAIAAAAGHSDKAMRDCLGRVVGEGILAHVEGRGRSARYRMTDTGRAELDADLGWTAFAHRVDAGLEPWDHNWRIIGLAIPERRRGARDALRSLLVEFGAAPLQPGLYVHAYELDGFVHQLADHLGVSDGVAALATPAIRIGDVRRSEELVARLWPLDELAGRYESIERRLTTIARQAPSTPADELAASMFSAIVGMETVLRSDPLLPSELLPADWAGSRARQAFRVAHAAASAGSDLFNGSRVMQSFAAEIDRSLAESSAEFWARWFPRLMQAYRTRLPPVATGRPSGVAGVQVVHSDG